MVQGVFTNKCTSSSQADFLVITHQGLYFYDDYTSLTSGPCLYEANYGATFYGFSNLPDVTQWEAAMAFQNSWVDIYTGGEVYRWQNAGNYLSKIGVYPKPTKSHIQFITSTSISITPTNLVWAVHRKDTGGHLVYYYDGTQYYLYNNQNPKQRVFLQNATDVIDQNSRDLNIWKDLPSNVVGLTAVDNSGAEFVYVTWPDMLHYKLDRHGQIHNLGQIKLS
ncbi:hypothetical protein FSP39_015786 [Pinctada imbricata]|uniref:Uncharacterized protein n=1 Tax=Pinctada imbricata TaxID=66713 RepID=A0AA89CDE4_PINIB|nr:hypothetical protein FSP39_015786 [Pinctada imbricata]